MEKKSKQVATEATPYDLTKIGTRTVSQYEGALFKLVLVTGETVFAIRQNDLYYEMERMQRIMYGNRMLLQFYCSSWPLDEKIIKGRRKACTILVENIGICDAEDEPIELGKHPFYLTATFK